MAEILDAIPICPLGVRVHVRLHDANTECSCGVVLLAHLYTPRTFPKAAAIQAQPHLTHILGRGIMFFLADAAGVDAVLHNCDAKLHLKDEIQWCHALQVRFADLSVLLIGFLGEIQHVRRKQRLAVVFAQASSASNMLSNQGSNFLAQ